MKNLAQTLRVSRLDGAIALGLWRPQVGSAMLTFLIALSLVVFYNVRFWTGVLAASSFDLRGIGFLLTLFLMLSTGFHALLGLVTARWVQKPVSVIVLIAAAATAHFTTRYGIMIDGPIMRSILETAPAEAGELIDRHLLWSVILMGVIPSILVCRTRIVYDPWPRALAKKLAAVLGAGAVIGAAFFGFYADYASLFRNHNELRHLLTPTNLFYQTYRYVSESGPVEVRPLGTDARLSDRARSQAKRTVVVLVLGETARAQNFSLNGYPRSTNPLLEQERLLNFSNVRSCGTATAVSVPCMFSDLTRAGFTVAGARSREGLLDVASHAGIRVLWRDNNTGCKGVCDRVETQEGPWRSAEGAADSESFDEAMLEGLDDWLDRSTEPALIVLHQQGSHGPAYWRRYPPEFRKFTPECRTDSLQDCEVEQVVNAYDNTIVYTDYFLSRVIDLLRARADRDDAAMLYTSDHGESLGEDRVWLHGLPYMVAPDEQTRVPFVLWLSDEFERAFELDSECLARRGDEPLTHDWLFHSMLGLLDVETAAHDGALDLFSTCRTRF